MLKTFLKHKSIICALSFVTLLLFGGFFIFTTLTAQAAMVAPPGPPPGPPPPTNQDPNLTATAQYKLDGQEALAEGQRTAGDEVVLEVTMSDPDDDPVKFRIEVCPKDDPFDNNCMTTGTIMESDFFPSGTTLKATTTPLLEDEYKWRVKVWDDQGGQTSWQEFGTPSNVDFQIDFVPKYTQNESEYPPRLPEDEWASEEYASGNTQSYYCGSTISGCGCAITSAVMTLRYHGVFDNIDGDNVDPYTINRWLKSTTTTSTADVIGYYYGNVNWKAIQKYAKHPVTKNTRIVFMGRYDGTPSNTTVRTILNNDLSFNQPVIVRNNPAGHFFLATDKLATTYLINDPFWYNTQNLNHNLTAQDITQPYNNYKRDYNNFYNGIRRFTPIINCSVNPCVWNIIDLTIASPAELVVIDPLGRRLGQDPLTGTVYNEIPDGSYTQEGIGNPDNPGPAPHQLKSLWIPNALAGQYQVKVIGTGQGDYTLFSTLSDQQGEDKMDKIEGHTQNAHQTVYLIDFNQAQASMSQIGPQDTVAPQTSINLDGQQGENDWYVTDVQVTLTAQDNPGGTGVYQTEYSLDNGQTWLVYTSPIVLSQNGMHTLLYRSEDFAANLEQTQSAIIQIDQAPPEAEMFFDPEIKTLVVQPRLGSTTVSKKTKCLNRLCLVQRVIYTLQDDAGHTLKLFFRQPKFQAKILTKLEKIKYNQDRPIKVNKYIHYFWITSWRNQHIKTLTQSIGNPAGSWIHAFYKHRLGKTILTIKKSPVCQEKLLGLVIVKFYTNQGEINYEY